MTELATQLVILDCLEALLHADVYDVHEYSANDTFHRNTYSSCPLSYLYPFPLCDQTSPLNHGSES